MRHADTKLRTDIQALRGLAVVLVVLYHAKIGWLEAGYLGVDIFFVISGFLITSMVAGGIQRGDFSLKEFYFRRAKRLLPAAYVVFAVTALLAPWLLNQRELQDLAWQVLGAVTFTANLFLWQQTGYFDGASELKPLLHTWSLSIEEQYYLLLPGALLLLRQRHWWSALATATLGSLALCLWAVTQMPSATFYLLPTRAWELLIGSLGALLVLRPDRALRLEASPIVRLLYLPSLGCLALVPALSLGGPHPGPGAVLVCLATLLVILRHHPRVASSPPARTLARVGDISYSLYLVHWPVLALMRNAYMGPEGDMPLEARVAAVLLSGLLAWVLYRLVEDPVRRARLVFSVPLLARGLAVSLVVMAIAPVGALATSTGQDFNHLTRINHGLSPECEYSSAFMPKPACEAGAGPLTLLWGDSYAMHLAQGLVMAGDPSLRIVQATKSGCGPVHGIGPERPVHPGTGLVYNYAWARSCVDFNDSVLRYIRSRTDLEIVVLSSSLGQYVGAEFLHNVTDQGRNRVVPASVEGSKTAIMSTVGALRQAGKRVVWFSPPPQTGKNFAGCVERELSGLYSWGGQEGCALARAEYEAKRSDVNALLGAIESAGVPVIRLDDELCDERQCQTTLDGVMVYRDQGHLSHDGAALLGRRMQWPRLVIERAR